MSCIERFSNDLRTQGFRMTPQRLTILEVLHEDGHVTPAQVYDRVCRRMTGITESTVYRTLDFLSQKGIIYSTNTPTGHLTYELALMDHHHIVCRGCGMHLDLEPDLLARFIDDLEEQTHFHLNSGHLTFFGLCPACQVSD